MKKTWTLAIMIITLLFNGTPVYALKEDRSVLASIEVDQSDEVNQQDQVVIVPPIIEESTTDNTEEIPYVKGDEIVLTLNSTTAYVNGMAYTLNNPPVIVGGSTYLPLRFIADHILAAEVKWDQKTQTVTVTKKDKEVMVTIGSNTAYVNGEAMSIEAVPITQNGTTLLPVRFICEQFELEVKYDKEQQKVTLIGPNKKPNTKPIASFSFSQVNYVAGQIVQAKSTSYDPDGDKLKDKLWSVVGEKTVTSKELSNIFKTPKAGIYTIGLRVQDQYGMWSDWTYQELTVLPNETPKVTHFGTTKESYMQGEDIDYEYQFENEVWESITNEKWTYRKASEDRSKAILGKPTALFTEGDYIITLQIDDAYGNRSEVVETTIHITDEIMKKELEYRFTEGMIGDIIDNYQGFNYRNYKDVQNITKSTVAGTMIMSDSPEVVTREGILYRDTINGKGRILIHHINNFSEASVVGGNKRFVMVAENTTTQPVTLTLSNKSIKGPVADVVFLGQKVLADYLMGSPDEVIRLAPGEKKYIYDTETKWVKGTCISGLMDVYTTGDVKFTMAAVSAGNTLNNMEGMELFLQAVHPRGTFDTIAINYNLTLDGREPEKLVIGVGEEEWVKGYDALTQDAAQNKGNFGISYYVTITAEEDMGIILNPRATTFKGAIKWKGEGVYNAPNLGTIYSNTAKAVLLGTLKKGETKTLEYMLPNGSAAPVLIGFIPKDYWSK